MIRLSALAVVLAFVALPVAALETPARGHLDARLRNVAYNQDQVFLLSATVGYATYIQFAPGEQMDSHWTGDNGWDIQSFKNLAVIKPIAVDPVTNLIITTTFGRLYNLDLKMVPERRGYYGVRFSYPAEDNAKALLAAQKDALAASMDPERQAHRNLAYTASGSRLIQPTAAFDNGRYTFLHFAENNNWPAVFRLVPSGDAMQETLVNPSVKGNWLILPRVGRAWRLRQGGEVLCIRNEAFNPSGANNPSETASPTTWRVDQP